MKNSLPSLVPVTEVTPGPAWMTVPEPPRWCPSSKEPERSTKSVALAPRLRGAGLRTSPRVPVAAPVPTCRVPALIVTAPVWALSAARIIVPAPSLMISVAPKNESMNPPLTVRVLPAATSKLPKGAMPSYPTNTSGAEITASSVTLTTPEKPKDPVKALPSPDSRPPLRVRAPNWAETVASACSLPPLTVTGTKG